jgi:surfeit locus 1 family protein
MTDPNAPARPFVRPNLWASLLAGLALCVLVGLGTWQLHRKAEKEALITRMQARGDGPAVALPQQLSPIEDLIFTRVAATGRYLHDKEMRLSNRVHKSEVGRHILTPFRLDDGRSLLVDRGWVPLRLEDPATRAESRIEASLSVEGIVRTGGFGGPAFLRPENAPEDGLYNWLDLEGMAEAAALENPITTMYLAVVDTTEEAKSDGRYPIPSGAQVIVRNDHLEYALTWFSLAGVLVAIFILYHRRRPPRT